MSYSLKVYKLVENYYEKFFGVVSPSLQYVLAKKTDLETNSSEYLLSVFYTKNRKVVLELFLEKQEELGAFILSLFKIGIKERDIKNILLDIVTSANFVDLNISINFFDKNKLFFNLLNKNLY